jgi:putative heme transporter
VGLVLAVGAVVVAGVRAPGAAGDVWADFVHLGGLRLAWLGVAVAAEDVSLAGGVAAQRRLLAASGARLRLRTLFGLVLVSTGLARVMPAGPVTGGAWQMREYRRRGAGAAAAVWAVLAGGFTSTMVVLASLLAGAAVAHPGRLPLLGCAAIVLAAGMAGLTAALRHARPLSHWLKRHHRRSPTIARLAVAVAGLSRARPGWAAWVLACTGVSLLADAGVLAACFGLAGLPVPWHGLLFAYAAGQLAVRVVPLPGGLGGVESGVIGALTLTGTPAAAAAAAVLVYRVGGYWAVGAAGAAAAAALARGPRPGAEAPQQLAGCHDPDGEGGSGTPPPSSTLAGASAMGRLRFPAGR